MAAQVSDGLSLAAIIGVVTGGIRMFTQSVSQREWNKNVDQTLGEHTIALRDGDRRLNTMEVTMGRIQANTEELLRRAERAERFNNNDRGRQGD